MSQVVQTSEDTWVIVNNDGSTLEATSYEANYATALLEAGWAWEFIINFFITPSRSLEIDFRVFTVPKQTFVFIDGMYFHSGFEAQHDDWERLMLYAKTKSYAMPPLTVKNPDCSTLEAARAHVLRVFGRR